MYVGLGDTPACNTLMVPTGTYGPFNCTGDQSQVMTYDPSGNAASASPLCIFGEISVNGQCEPIAQGVEDWFLTGYNALYVGLGVLAFAVLMGMGRR
jgi:hypothetical protein